MGGIPDNAARIEALNTNSSFIVQAPAGSGKTSLLTQRFLALLSKVSKPEKIIIQISTLLSTRIWVPGSLNILSDLGLRPDMRAGDLSPGQFMKLFLLLLKNGSFHNTWWEDEAYEQIHSINNRAA